MSGSRLRKGLLASGATALLLPVVLGGVMAAAVALTGEDTPQAIAAQPAPKPAPHKPGKPHTLSALGRAAAVSWVGGHTGR